MADPGTLGSFTDFMTATRDIPIGTPDKIPNQMNRHQTYLTRLMMAGLAEKEYFSSGVKFVEQLQLKYTGNYRNYLPTDTQTPTGQNTLAQLEVPWRYSLVDNVWYDQEVELNSGGDLKTIYKKLAKVKRQTMLTDFWDGVNDALWALPDSTMEGGPNSGTKPNSLLCFITIGDGVPNTTAVASFGDGATGTFTTIEQINTTTYPNWDNQRVAYTTATLEADLEDKFDEMHLRLQWEAPEEGGGGTGVVDTSINKMRILTNREGYNNIVKIARQARVGGGSSASNFAERGDRGRLYYRGIEIKYISALDSTSICPSGSPKFFFVNFSHIRPVFRTGRFLKPKVFEGTVSQPMANAEYRDTWWNLICVNRREQGIVYASA